MACVQDDLAAIKNRLTVVETQLAEIPEGVPGPQGPRGFPGINGTNGLNGTNGVDGEDGLDGAREFSQLEGLPRSNVALQSELLPIDGLTKHDLRPVTFDMHYEALLGIGWQSTELGGELTSTLTASAAAGSNSLTVASSAIFRAGQLIHYAGADGDIWPIGIRSIASNTLLLDRPLQVAASNGAVVGPFYRDDAHATVPGYKSIVHTFLRQYGFVYEDVYTGRDESEWTASDGATKAAYTANSYLNPGCATYPAARVTGTAVYGAITTRELEIPAGNYVLEIVVNPGSLTTGPTSNTVKIGVRETQLGDNTPLTIAERDVSGFDGCQLIKIPFNKSKRSTLSLLARAQLGGPYDFSVGHFRIRRVLGKATPLTNDDIVGLGDSWFAGGTLLAELAARLPNATITNKGIAGHKASDERARYTADVINLAPKRVIIINGNNDDYAQVSQITIEQNNRDMISKGVQAGIQTIIFSGPPTYKDYAPVPGNRLLLSREYAIGTSYSDEAEIPVREVVVTYNRSDNAFAEKRAWDDEEENTILISSEPTEQAGTIRLSTDCGGPIKLRVGYCDGVDDTALDDEQIITQGGIATVEYVIDKTSGDPQFFKAFVKNESGGPLFVAYSTRMRYIV